MNCKDRLGFTLLEVMIAVAILAISLLALMRFQSQSVMASGRAERILTSTLLAQKKMGEILLEIEKGIPKGDFPDQKEDGGIFDEETTPGFYWKMQVKKVEFPTPPAPEGESTIIAQAFQMISEELGRSSREVRLTVGWVEFEEEQEGITLITHVVNPLGGG